MPTRVPEKDSLFDQYLQNTTAVLEDGTPTGAVRLGLSTEQADQWIAYRDQWIVLYPKYTDPAQRTITIKNEKNLLKKNFRIFAENPLKLIEASANLTEDDRGTFHLPERDRVPTTRGNITDVPFGSLKGKGGGMLEVRVRREEDATRSSMHELSDAVELRYQLVTEDVTNPPNPEPPGAGLPGPEHLNEVAISTKALWRINLGSTAQGKRVVGFVRWLNLNDSSRNSGWSDLMTTFVS